METIEEAIDATRSSLGHPTHDETNEQQYKFRSGNLFVVDSSPGMFLESKDEDGLYFQQCLSVYEAILREKLSHNSVDWMGLMIFGTTRSDPGVKNILTLLKFGPVTVDMLLQLLKISENEISYYETAAAEDAYPVASVLHHASRAFDPEKTKMPYRQINLITCHDNPSDDEERRRMRVNARTLRNINVGLQVVGLGDDWDHSRFYKHLEMLAADSDQLLRRVLLADLEDQLTRLTRVITYLDLRVGADALVKVALLPLSKRRRYVLPVLLNKKTNEVLDEHPHYQRCEDSQSDDEHEVDNEEVEPSSVRRTVEFGGRSIYFTSEEFKYIHRLKDKGVEILRFKRASENFEYHIQSALFLELLSNASSGKAEFFTALLMKCVEKGLVAICMSTPKANAKTQLYTMAPSLHRGGFYFYRIPFVEEISTNMEHLFSTFTFNRGGAEFNVNPKKFTAMTNLTKQFKMKYNPRLFPNPSTSRRLQIIQCVALQEPLDDIDDFTKPIVETLSSRLSRGSVLADFYSAFPNSELPEEAVGRKVPRYDFDTAMKMLRSSRLSSYTSVQLRAMLKGFRLSTSGIKQDLLERLAEYKQLLPLDVVNLGAANGDN